MINLVHGIDGIDVISCCGVRRSRTVTDTANHVKHMVTPDAQRLAILTRLTKANKLSFALVDYEDMIPPKCLSEPCLLFKFSPSLYLDAQHHEPRSLITLGPMQMLISLSKSEMKRPVPAEDERGNSSQNRVPGAAVPVLGIR